MFAFLFCQKGEICNLLNYKPKDTQCQQKVMIERGEVFPVLFLCDNPLKTSKTGQEKRPLVFKNKQDGTRETSPCPYQ